MYSARLFLVLAIAVFSPTLAHSDDADEVKRLRDKLELLEAKLELAERKNQDLTKEIEKLQSHQDDKPVAAERENLKQSPLSELLDVGTILEGELLGKNNLRSKMTITIKEKNGNRLKGEQILDFLDGRTVKEDVEITIKNNKSLTIKRVGTTRKLEMDLSQKGDSLYGNWVNHLNDRGTVAIKLKL